MASSSYAIQFGPDGMFSLYGFAEATVGLNGSYCLDCQVANPDFSNKQLRQADAIIPGKEYGTKTTTLWQIQPALSAKYKLGRGYEVSGTIEQRWRDGTVDGAHVETRYGGKIDLPDFWYSRNIALSHEDYGSIRVGSMLTRGWSVADAPYGSNLGMSDAWGATGSAYGMLTQAIRYNTRLLDVAQGDLYLEFTYDRGNTGFSRLKPQFYEAYAQFHKGDLVVDAVYQSGTNGGPSAWAHAPFVGLTNYPVDDSNPLLTGNKQTNAMVMGRYQVNSKVEVSGGLRRNSWSGTNVFFSQAAGSSIGFNVDYSNLLSSVLPGYPATSVDLLLGLRYNMDKWVFSTGAVYLGKSDTNNPSERGQSNSALINTIGAKYDLGRGLQFEATAGNVRFAELGLSPMSMTSNSFNNVDSRITRDGRWLTVGFIYLY
jgi:hypothetical protein